MSVIAAPEITELDDVRNVVLAYILRIGKERDRARAEMEQAELALEQVRSAAIGLGIIEPPE